MKEAYVIPEENDLLINYLMLAQAIIFSDLDNGQDYVVCVYDVEENERLVAVFNNIKRCARFLNITVDCIYKSIKREVLIKSRFKIEKLKCGTTSTNLEYYKLLNEELNEKVFRRYR